MKSLLKIFTIIILIGVPAAIYAQGDASAKHAINTKGAGSGDKAALPACPAVEQSVIIAAQERLITRTKSNQTNERSGLPVSVTPNGIQPENALKTRTKSNNANERTAAPAVTVLQTGCAESTVVDPGQAISFKVTPPKTKGGIKNTTPSYDQDCSVRIWQLKEGQTAADGMTPENLVLEKIVKAGIDFLDLDGPPRRPRDVSTSFVWEVQPLDAAGKAVGGPLISTYDLATIKK
jgi:hypothetical protein